LVRTPSQQGISAVAPAGPTFVGIVGDTIRTPDDLEAPGFVSPVAAPVAVRTRGREGR